MSDTSYIPRNGQVIIIAYFGEYTSYMQNESRRLLLRAVPTIGEGVGIGLTPLLFAILRHVDSKVSRPVGVLYTFGYQNMTKESFDEFYEALKNDFGKREQVSNMWSDYDVMVATEIGGL